MCLCSQVFDHTRVDVHVHICGSVCKVQWLMSADPKRSPPCIVRGHILSLAFVSVLARVSFFHFKLMNNRNLEGERFILSPTLWSIMEEVRAGSQGKNPKSGIEAEAMEKFLFLDCSP